MDVIDAPTYQIIFLDSIEAILETIFQKYKDVKFLVLTDDNLNRLYHKEIESIFHKANRQHFTFVLNNGEINKTRYQKTKAENFLFQNKFERDDIIIAIGGGLVGDFSGYLASTYLRGIRFIQVPTTILSMVDASIGSKTGVNTEYGKNLVGSIYDPSMICVNVNFLRSLDKRNIQNGVAEMIKAALLFDKEYFVRLSNANFSEMVKNDPAALKPLIRRSAELKLKVTNADKREFGLRKLLNFGHTIGHAIEFTLKGELLHGECVAIGMVLETELAYSLGLCEEGLIETIKDVCKKHKLPVDLPQHISITSVMKYMENDKKNKTNDIHFVFLKDVSDPYEKTFAVSKKLIRKTISPSYAVGSSHETDIETVKDVKFPGSKSITNRALLIAALGQGTVELNGVLDAEDTHIMLKALVDLQACEILKKHGDTVIIKGNGGKLQSPKNAIYTENSGTSARFLSSILLMLHGTATLDGNSRMKERPIGDLLDAFKLQKSVEISFLEKENSIPFQVKSEGFYGGEIRMKSKVSSQFVSSILMSAPYALNPVKLVLEDVKEDDKIVSEPYIDMTIQIMEKFGIKVKRTSYNTFEVPQGIYVNPSQFSIEPDASTASYELIYHCFNEGKRKILYLGSESVQGDAGFAGVLKQAGANITISTNHIEIFGGSLKDMKPIDINLANQTDTFMGLAVVLSQIEGISYIRGIANQRVKECDRIRATRKNLMKCGIFCKELEDGLEIHGRSLQQQKQQVGNRREKTRVLIKTYNDHRLAMSFANLGIYFANNGHHLELVIQNRLCVGKTFPGFWKHMETNHGADFEGLSEEEVKPRDLDPNAPLFIIGMRYAGKSNFGRLIAERLGKTYLDMDAHLVEDLQKEDPALKSVQDLVEKHGWKAWRDKENQFLETIVKNQEAYKDYVISTGGGVVEAKQNTELFHQIKNTIMIDRSFFDIEKSSIEYEKTDHMRPQLSATSTLSEIYIRRFPNYLKSSKRIFSFPSFHKMKEHVMINEMEYWVKVRKMYSRFVKGVFGEEPNPFIPDESFFLTVDLKVLDNLSPQYAKYINSQYNAVELRVDYLMQEYREKLSVNEVFQLLVEKISYVKFWVEIPIILTLRTKLEGGSFIINDKNDYKNFYHQIYLLLSKTNLIDIYDIEYCAENMRFLQYFRGRISRKHIILSKHYTSNISENQVLSDIEVMNECEEADIIKIVLNEKHSLEILNQVVFEKPLIRLKLGNLGKHSRVECKFLCPVFDPLFGASLAPGQMSKEEIMNVRYNTGLTPKFKTFYLFGSHVTKGLSPIIHNTYFNYHNLHNCYYDRKEVHSIEEVMKVINEDPYFKGASITMPFKKEIIPYLHSVHSVAKELGVVNTVVKFCDKLYGFNTDWIGMYKPLKPMFDKRTDLRGRPYGLIIGAGATSETAIYIMNKLGLKTIVYNRSRERLMSLKEQKPEISICTNLETLEIEEGDKTKTVNPDEIAVIIGVVPGFNDLVYPVSIFKGKPIVFDVAYIPKETRFIQEARKNGCESIIYGMEMLLHQGYVQDEYFIGKKPPKKYMSEVVWKHYDRTMSVNK